MLYEDEELQEFIEDESNYDKLVKNFTLADTTESVEEDDPRDILDNKVKLIAYFDKLYRSENGIINFDKFKIVDIDDDEFIIDGQELYFICEPIKKITVKEFIDELEEDILDEIYYAIVKLEVYD